MSEKDSFPPIVKGEDSCGSCGMWNHKGREKMAERSRAKPIYGTDFSAKPLWQIVEDIRDEVSRARGHLTDISFGYSGWKQQTETAEGLLTCGLSYLYHLARDMEKAELSRLGDVVRWHPRGMGSDHCACFGCPGSQPDLRSNVAAFVDTKEAGEKVVAYLGYGARLDFRDYEPNWIQVKVGACETHHKALETLAEQWYVGPDTREACGV